MLAPCTERSNAVDLVAKQGACFYSGARMDRQFLIFATICYLAAVIRTVVSFRARIFRRSRFVFLTIALGFVLQTTFLTVRGHTLGSCPITNLFEVLVFLAWSIALIYLLIGPA